MSSFEDLVALGSDTEDGVTFDFGDGDLLILKGTELAALDGNAFTFA